MKLLRIELNHYRNIEALAVVPCEGINMLYGDNAQGKTNFMEAVWLFTGNSSFRGAKTSELIQFGQSETRLSIQFADREREQTAFLGFSGGANQSQRKKILLNNVECKSISELNGNFYSVVFSPTHLSLVQEGPKGRRKFLDIAISEIKPQYESCLSQYEKLIEQRNALLRGASGYSNLAENIDVWDIQLARAGTVLSIYRADYVRKLNSFAKDIYKGLSSEKESFNIRYESTAFREKIGEVDRYEEQWVDRYYQALKDSFSDDMRQGYTGVGIHRDDLEVIIDGISVKTYGSQGQQRSSVIALKLAEAKLLQRATGENPVMLLDDVMSELDVSRQGYILNHLKGMQVFITCCDPSNAMRLETGKVFHIRNGAIAEENG